MSTSRGSFVNVHVGQGLLIRHVWMPSNGLFDMSGCQVMAYSTVWMPLMVSNAPYACRADGCTGLLVC